MVNRPNGVQLVLVILSDQKAKKFFFKNIIKFNFADVREETLKIRLCAGGTALRIY